MGGSRGTAKSLKKCEVIMVLPYIVKYALLHIGYFWIRVFHKIFTILFSKIVEIGKSS